MPILLNDIQNTVTSTSYTPKFFSDDFTGSGKSIGLINQDVNPINTPASDPEVVYMMTVFGKIVQKNGNTTIKHVAVHPISTKLIENGMYTYYPVPDKSRMCKLGSINKKYDIYLRLEPYQLILESTTDFTGKTTKTLRPIYRMTLFSIDNTFVPFPTTAQIQQYSKLTINTPLTNTSYSKLTANPVISIQDAINTLKQGNAHLQPKLDINQAINYMANYCLYDELCLLSERWQTALHEDIKHIINCAKNQNWSTDNIVNQLNIYLSTIEKYKLSLQLYRNIYTTLQQEFNADTVAKLCKANLNLLLSDTLQNLSKNKSNIQTFSPQTDPTKMPFSLKRFSTEQQKAITCTDPLVLVQAGAGTGKSTVILGRIDYMIASGVKPDDITVLSFTNAAADNIKDRNPNVHSMTISRMIHTIYETNFPGQELSSVETLVNCIMIYLPNDPVAQKFRALLRTMIHSEKDGYTDLNNFVENNFNDVIRILNTVKQTCLPLESIICYQCIGNLVEPPEVQSKYLILDEVQDNSIFDFIYTLKYVDKHNECLFIVGDCSQTLYEFRASNPMALNIMESSGVFTTFPLQINYRSNQEILNFANTALRNIEANQFAHIQLQANSLAKVTEQSFKNKVHLHYTRVARMNDFKMNLEDIFLKNVCPFIDKKLAAKEQVAFLSYTRDDVYKMQTLLTKFYSSANIVSLVPEKQYNATVLSAFIMRYWDELKFAPAKTIGVTILHECMNRLSFLVSNPDKQRPKVQKMLTDWMNEAQPTINMWYDQCVHNQLSHDAFLENVKEHLLQYEIQSNAVRQALLSAKNNAQKTNQNVKNANFLLSTIHSAKGLEFENTVVLYKATSHMAEDEKRMYYVALTRAMKAEFVLAYGTLANPQIQADYDSCVKTLHNKAIANAIANS